MSLALIVVFFHLSFGGGGNSDNQAKAILDFVLSIIPGDIFSPFVNGNTIQIIFMAMLTGGVMLGMRSRLGEAEKLTRQLNLIVQQIFEMVLWFLPTFIYLSILRIGLSENLSSLTQFITTLLAFVVGLVVMDLFLLAVVKIRTRQPILPFLKAAFPSVMIALLTQSSAATFSEASSNMTDHLGIRKKLVDFGLPIGYILCKPASTMWMMLLSSTCMIISNIPITPVKMITLILVAVILCVAMPPVPGGAMVCYTLLFSQLGIPNDMLALLSVFELAIDALATTNNVFALQAELYISAGQLRMVDGCGGE